MTGMEYQAGEIRLGPGDHVLLYSPQRVTLWLYEPKAAGRDRLTGAPCA